MPHALGDRAQRLAGLHQVGGKRVPQVMEPQPGKARPLRDVVERLGELTKDDGRAVGVRKNEPVARDAGPTLGCVCLKTRQMLPEQLEGGVVQVDGVLRDR